MAIGGKKKGKDIKITLPNKGFKRVVQAIRGENPYKVSNPNLGKYFNKNGTIKKSALRSNKARKEFKKELEKAKKEVAQQRKDLAQLRRQLKKDRQEKRQEELKRKLKEKKDKQKRERQIKTYKENGHGLDDVNTYETFIDILDDVYDEVSLIFYDSDQVMSWIDSNMSIKDIKDLLKSINKRKEEQLTPAEKELMSKGKYHLDTMKKEELTNEVAEIVWLANRQNDLSPEQIWNMKQYDFAKYEQWKSNLEKKNR